MLRAALLQAAVMVSDLACGIDPKPSLISDLCECIDGLNKDLRRLANNHRPSDNLPANS
jgi:hypothetical protein